MFSFHVHISWAQCFLQIPTLYWYYLSVSICANVINKVNIGLFMMIVMYYCKEESCLIRVHLFSNKSSPVQYKVYTIHIDILSSAWKIVWLVLFGILLTLYTIGCQIGHAFCSSARVEWGDWILIYKACLFCWTRQAVVRFRNRNW